MRQLLKFGNLEDIGNILQVICPVCGERSHTALFTNISGHQYYSCADCDLLFIEPDVLEKMDGGVPVRPYDDAYWSDEEPSARERARADGLVRSGEAILYSRREMRRFLDIGTGPGLLLDELASTYPQYPQMFNGVEMFPPPQHSSNPNYVIGSLADLNGKFDGGVCIEVIEHITPTMLRALAMQLAEVSEVDSLWLFNSGMPEYVRVQDPGYLDPLGRGHIISYGIPALQRIFEPAGFRVSAIPGMTFAWIAEFRPTQAMGSFADRFYNPIPFNRKLLVEGGLMFPAAFESARSYHFQAESSDRGRWAHSLLNSSRKSAGFWRDLVSVIRR